jgi:hypothetical protein
MTSMLASLDEPLYILKDYVASEPTTLRAKHNGKGGFTFSKTPETGTPEILFKVDSRSSLKASQRVINDASSGQPVLELWQNHVGDESYIGIPNIASLPLAAVAPRPTKVKDRVDVYVKNAARANEETKLEIRGQDSCQRDTCVYRGDDLVMQVRFVNYITSRVPFSSNQWDVVVAEGFDLSLVRLVFAVAMGFFFLTLRRLVLLSFIWARLCVIVVSPARATGGWTRRMRSRVRNGDYGSGLRWALLLALLRR